MADSVSNYLKSHPDEAVRFRNTFNIKPPNEVVVQNHARWAQGATRDRVINSTFPSYGNPVTNNPGIATAVGFGGGVAAGAAVTAPLFFGPPGHKKLNVPGEPPFQGGQTNNRYIVTFENNAHE